MKWFLRIAGTLLALLVILFLIFRTPDTDPEEMRAKYGGPPSQFVEIGNGVTVHLRDEGPSDQGEDAPVIVLLHGSNADLHTWEPWAEQLREKYRVIRFDSVGHGLTGADPAGDYSIENYVADIDEVADALGLESFILGGNSMGGGHSVAYALAHPDRLDGLILVDAGGADVRRETSGNIGFSIARTPVINQLMKHITPRSLVERSLSQSVTNQDIVTEEAVDRYWEMLRYPGNRGATLARFTTSWQPYSAQQVASIATDTLIIWGEEDSLISVDAGRWFDEHLPDSTLIIYPGIGHLPQEELAEESASAVDLWIGSREPEEPAL